MTWTDLKENIYYVDGSLRDLFVLQLNRAEWETWVKYVNSNYRIEWLTGELGEEKKRIDFNTIINFWDGNGELWSTARIFIDRIQINEHFSDDTEIENDIDPREFNSMEDHQKLLKYMSDVSVLLNKEVILTPENERETILIKVNKQNVEFTKDTSQAK